MTIDVDALQALDGEESSLDAACTYTCNVSGCGMTCNGISCMGWSCGGFSCAVTMADA